MQDADSEGYDSDSAAAVVNRLKQLRQGQGSHAAHEKEPRREDERDAGSRCRSSGQERICEDRSHRGGSRRDDGREHRSSRDRELHDSDSRDARHSHKGGQRGSERDRHSSRDRGRDRDRDRDRRDGDRAKREEPRASRYAFSRSYSHRQHSKQQAQPPKAAKPDFERVIPGYATMSAAQKLKARTQYLLERSSQRDKQRQADRDRDEGGWDELVITGSQDCVSAMHLELRNLGLKGLRASYASDRLRVPKPETAQAACVCKAAPCSIGHAFT